MGDESADRPLRLREHDFLFRTVLGSPRPNPPFQSPTVVRLEFRFGVPQIVEHRDGLDVGASLQNGDDLGFEERGQGIRASALTGRGILGRLISGLFPGLFEGPIAR